MGDCSSFTFVNAKGETIQAKSRGFIGNKGSKGIVRIEADTATGRVNVSPEQVKALSTNIEVGGVSLQVEVSNHMTVLNSGSTSAINFMTALTEKSGHGTNSTAEIDAAVLAGALGGKGHQGFKDSFYKWFNENGQKKGFFGSGTRKAYEAFNRVVFLLKTGDEAAAYKLAGHEDWTAGSGPDPLARHKEAVRSVQTSLDKTADKLGLKRDPNYLPIQIDGDAFRDVIAFMGGPAAEAVKRFGREVIAPALLKSSDQNLRDILTPESAKIVGEVVAQKYHANSIGAGEYTKNYRSFDDEIRQAVTDIMEKTGLSEVDAIKIASALGQSTYPAVPGHLKQRVIMDRNHTVTITGANGQTRNMAVRDIYHQDVLDLHDGYIHTMSKYLTMERLGFHDRAEFDKVMNNTRSEMVAAGKSHTQVERVLEIMDHAWRGMMGYPISNPGVGMPARIGKTLMGISTVKSLGMYVLRNTMELGAPMVYGGVRSYLHKSGIVDIIQRYLKEMGSMPADSPLIRSIRATGLMETAQKIMWKPEYAKAIDGYQRLAEDPMRTVRDVHGKAVGINFFTRMQEELSFAQVAQALYDMSTGRRNDQKLVDRWARMGMKQELVERISTNFQKYAKTESNGLLLDIDFEKWQTEDWDSYANMLEVMKRETNYLLNNKRAVDIPPLLENNIVGKLAMQMRGWMIPMWNASAVGGIGFLDVMTFQKVAAVMTIGVLTKATDNYINYGHDEKELEKRNNMEQLMLDAFANSGISFMLPGMIDFGLGASGHEKWFDNSRFSGGASGLIAGNPTVSLVDSVYTSVKDLAGAPANGMTKGQVKGVANTILPTFYGKRRLVDMIAELPDTVDKRPKATPFLLNPDGQ